MVHYNLTPDVLELMAEGTAALCELLLRGGAQEVPTRTIEAPAWSEDGNSVNAEQELMTLAANNLQFNATVEVLSRQLGLLEYAASDGGK